MKQVFGGGVIVFKKESNKTKYFLIKNLKRFGGHWSFSKGHQDKKEPIKTTARRELFEETGIKINKFIRGFEEVSNYQPSYSNKVNKTVTFFLSELKKETEIVICKTEIEQYKWCTYLQAQKLFSHKRNKDILKKAHRFIHEDITEKQAISILKKYSTDKGSFEKVLKHCKTVRDFTLKISRQIIKNNPSIKLDLKFLNTASLLHDIGRFQYPPWKESVKHGVAGAKVLLKENLPRHANVAQNHLGSGITKQVIKNKKLPIPKKDYLPKTLEEKIITYADNRTFNTRIVSEKQVERRFELEMPESLNRLKELNKEINNLIK